MSGLIEHAKREFLIAGYKPIEEEEDGPNKWIQENLIELLELFSKQGHSGFSASYCIRSFEKLANFKPLSPLTGDESEWIDTGSDCFQNNRDPRIFKDKATGTAYTIEGYVFREPSGSCFSSGYSRKLVTFPYTPAEPKHVDVISIEVNKDTGEPEPGSGWWETTYPQWIVEESKRIDKMLCRAA